MSYFNVNYKTVIQNFGYYCSVGMQKRKNKEIILNNLLDYKNLFLSINKNLEIHTYESEQLLFGARYYNENYIKLESLKGKNKLFLKKIYILPRIKNFNLKVDLKKEFEILFFKKDENRELIFTFFAWPQNACFYSEKYKKVFNHVDDYLKKILEEDFKETKTIENVNYCNLFPGKELIQEIYVPETMEKKIISYIRWNAKDLKENNINEKDFINSKINEMLKNPDEFKFYEYEIHIRGILI